MKRKLKIFFELLICLYVFLKLLAFFFLRIKIQNFFKEPYNYIALVILISVISFIAYKAFRLLLSDFSDQENKHPKEPLFRVNYGLATIVFILGFMNCYDMFFNRIDTPGENLILKLILNIFILMCTIFLGGFLFYKFAQWYSNRKDSWL